MRCEIDVELGELANEWEPVAFRRPKRGELFFAGFKTCEAEFDFQDERHLIVCRKWTPQPWLKPGWIAQEQNGEWWWHADEPLIVCGSWENDVACLHLLQDALDFTPPPCDDWKQSKRRIN